MARGPAAQRPDRPGRGPARDRRRRDGAALGPDRHADDAGDDRRRGPRHQVHRLRRALRAAAAASRGPHHRRRGPRPPARGAARAGGAHRRTDDEQRARRPAVARCVARIVSEHWPPGAGAATTPPSRQGHQQNAVAHRDRQRTEGHSAAAHAAPGDRPAHGLRLLRDAPAGRAAAADRARRGRGRHPLLAQRPQRGGGPRARSPSCSASSAPPPSTRRCWSWSTRRAGTSGACPARPPQAPPPRRAAPPRAPTAAPPGGSCAARASTSTSRRSSTSPGPTRALADEGRTLRRRRRRRVTAKAGAFADGLRAAGVEPVLKHFPGFGAASINTDNGAARIDLPLATLRAVDCAPYASSRPRAVMLSTADLPARRPAARRVLAPLGR